MIYRVFLIILLKINIESTTSNSKEKLGKKPVLKSEFTKGFIKKKKGFFNFFEYSEKIL